jgi:predicted dehydrogenase
MCLAPPSSRCAAGGDQRWNIIMASMERVRRIQRHLKPRVALAARTVGEASERPAPTPTTAPQVKKPMGFGIIGSGDIARSSFAPALLASQACELAAVCRRDAAKAAEFALEHGRGCAAYGSAQELLRDPAVEAVLIATPTHTHAELTILAARHGKHVLVEKPMARDAAECQAMITACERAGVSLGVCYRRKTFPQVVKATQLIAEGAIGEVLAVRTHCSSLTEKLKEERGNFSDAWGAEARLGGAMMEMASHRIEVCAACPASGAPRRR